MVEAASWKGGLLEVTWREPFTAIQAGVAAAKASEVASNCLSIGRDSRYSNSLQRAYFG
jgi:hypothetical protein